MTRKSTHSAFLRPVKSIVMAVAILFLRHSSVSAQTSNIDWRDMGGNARASFYDVQRQFHRQMDQKIHDAQSELKDAVPAKGAGRGEQEEEDMAGVELFQRWEAFMAPRVYPSGNMTLPYSSYTNFKRWLSAHSGAGRSGSLAPVAGGNTGGNSGGNWMAIGPVGKPSGLSTGTGRLNFLKFDPINAAIMWVGAPDGGLWKSTDSGASWSTNTDFLSVIGCSDIVIDPTNTNNMYLVTGDRDGQDRYSIGILKSTNGGLTWNPTSLVFQLSDYHYITRLLMDPNNPLVMIASSNTGTYRTTDGWATYTTGHFPGGNTPRLRDMKAKPFDFNTVYAARDTFWKSTDGGLNWAPVISNLPTSNVRRISIGVSPANGNLVYALIGNDSDHGFLGFYKSSDAGNTFTFMSDSPNILGWQPDGSDAGGQDWYDLAIVVSPTDSNRVTVGGVNHWQTTDGGSTWQNLSYWASGIVHADVHDLNYLPGSGSVLFSCNDGGIFKSWDNGTNWTDISHNLTIGQVVGIGLSATSPGRVVEGEQDNGTNLRAGTSWSNIYGGDGGQCFIDRTNDNTIYVQYVNGAFARSDNGGGSFSSIAGSLPSGFDFYSSWIQDPVMSTRIYVGGYNPAYVSSDKGNTWTALASSPGTGSVLALAVAPSNNNVIYTVQYDAIAKSTDGGLTFSNITGALPTSAAFSNIAVSNTNADHIWVTYSGYSAGDKVYKSTDGGTTWTNVSAGIPNVPINTLVYMSGSAIEEIYIGGDLGVFYLNNNLSAALPFMTGLPNVAMKQLQIFLPTRKIRAATYGRSVWESDLFSNCAAPAAPASVAMPTTPCVGDTARYTVPVVAGATSYVWTVAGNGWTGSSSTNSILLTTGRSAATLSVIAVDSCGSSSAYTFTAPVGSCCRTVAATFNQRFEGATFPGMSWSSDLNWGQDSGAGGFGLSAHSAFIDNYDNSNQGARYYLYSPALDFSRGVINTSKLKFDYAYSPYTAYAGYTDSLQVMYSTDCGATWSQLWKKGGVSLGTAPASTDFFTPAANQWKTDSSISLASLVGQSSVTFAFADINAYGNNIYLDNIRIDSFIPCTASLSVTCNNTNLDVSSSRVMTATPTNGGTRPVYNWYYNGSMVAGIHGSVLSYGGALGNGDQIYCTMLPATGCATGQLATSNTITFTKTGSSVKDIITFTMPAQVSPSVINNASATVRTVVTTAPAGRTAIHPTRLYTTVGSSYGPSYAVNRDFSAPVTYTVVAQDGSRKIWTVTVLDQSGNKTGSTTDNLNALNDMNVYPDPATTYINVQAAGGAAAPVITILDMAGRVMYQQELPVTDRINHQIDVTQFATGSYIMYVSVGEAMQTRQFVVGK